MNDVLLNIPRLYTGLAEWLFALLYILFARKRFEGIKLYGIIIGFFIILLGFQYWAGFWPIMLWIPGMIVSVGLMFLFIYIACEMRLRTALYFVSHAFLLAEFTASLMWQIYYFLVVNQSINRILWLELLFLFVMYGMVFLFMLLMEARYKKNTLPIGLKRNDVTSVVLIAMMVFAVGNLNFVEINTPFNGSYPADIFYIRTLVLLVGVVMLYTQREHRLASFSIIELSAVNNILSKQYDQYKFQTEAIDLVNQRYHDLKHQIQVIRNETNPEKKEAYLNDLEKDISMYGSLYNTGSDVVDTILATKAKTLYDKHINFTCVSDGKRLDILSVMDIVSIFGNALDNAIESVSGVASIDKRLIKLSIYSKHQLLMIKIENYYEHDIKKENGELVTTKKDTLNHGYGIKSIKSVVKKYDGEVSIDTADGWFRLYILIPIPSVSV